MPKSSNQKAKILYLMRFLLENTDEEHPAGITEIADALKRNGICAERKSLYDDIALLRDFGLDVIMVKEGRHTGYFIGSRDFQDAELKYLADSVESSNFITRNKTKQLISKIAGLTSVYKGAQLERQVHVRNRVKNMEESVYINVDRIFTAINEDRKIRFRYFEYDIMLNRTLKRNGECYEVSPFAMVFVDQNYYLIAYDSGIRHYRVDRMTQITLTGRKREGAEEYNKIDLSTYTSKVFHMFNGEERSVRIRFQNHLIGSVVDRFGTDIPVVREEDGWFSTTLNVAVSPQFYAWLYGFGEEAEILSPEEVRTGMKDMTRRVLERYCD